MKAIYLLIILTISPLFSGISQGIFDPTPINPFPGPFDDIGPLKKDAYRDKDTDGWGDPNDKISFIPSIFNSNPPAGYILRAGDCNDSDANIRPDTVWYLDFDKDGFGSENPIERVTPFHFEAAGYSVPGIFYQIPTPSWTTVTNTTKTGCYHPSGEYTYVRRNGDCNNLNSQITPDTVWYKDGDGDGYGVENITKTQCIQPSGYVRNNVLYGYDCNDADSRIRPNTIWYKDEGDGDDFGDKNNTKRQCEQPTGYVISKDDECPGVYGINFGCPDTTLYTPVALSNENSVFTRVYQKGMTSADHIKYKKDVIESVTYFDGLGKAKQSIAIKAGGQSQQSQGANLIDWTGDWTIGKGRTPLFNMNGQLSENERLFDTNPFGEQSIVWKCGNDAAKNADGGWNTEYMGVDKTVGYRYMVWVKRTGSQYGSTYHGTQNVNNLNGTTNNNPYFWAGDLPQLDTWYLLVGVVHPYTYAGGNSGISGVYDINGVKVISGNDFKWRSNTTTSRFRNYLYYSTDINVRQYFWNPVLTTSDNNQQSINAVIAQSKPKDIVTHFEYDQYGRQTKQYLPYTPDQTQDGEIYTDPVTAINSFYNTDRYENTTNPYSETVFEASPLNRPLKQAAPGNSWKAKATGADHTIKFDRRANNSDDAVVYFKVNFTDDDPTKPTLEKVSIYDDYELLVSITKDENWKASDGTNHTTKEFTNKSGKVVLKRAYNNEQHDTYYVYDDFGNLTYVIPPKVDNSDDVSTIELSELCYQYTYDDRNRLIKKKIPGKGWEYIIYNKLNQPVLTQDANQRVGNSKKWLFTKYDVHGRVAYTGSLIDNRDPDIIRTELNDFTADLWVTRGDQVIIGGVTMYYTNDSYPNAQFAQVLTINYYDDYIFDTNGVDKPDSVYGVNTINYAKGLITGSKVRILGTNQWTTAVTAYDNKARAIWLGNNNAYLNASDFVATKLDFTGKPLKVRTTHHKGTNHALVTTDFFTYDHMGRLVSQKQKINNQEEELITYNVYDALGQLVRKKVGNAEQAPLQTVDYSYNVRGWLTGINDTNTTNDDLFSFKINYDTPDHGATALFNGNISETEWKTASDNTKRWYKYSYDPLNRVTKAIDNDNKYSLSKVSYDKNGNIMYLARRGAINTAATSFNSMDNLTYQYDLGNKLLKVDETNTKYFGFKSQYNGNYNHYAYDTNGNMTIDRNKGISSISYNHLNLPTGVSIVNSEGTGNISYIYDATGAKLKKIVSGGSSLTTEYAGNYVYKDGVLQFFNTTEGYVEPENDGTYSYVYQYKDHLGNIRLSYSDSNNDGNVDVIRNDTDVDGDDDNIHEILQEKNYYPFGLEHNGYNSLITGRKHNYGFNGVELEESLGFDMYETDYRQYDSALGRFFTVDPLNEVVPSINPYQFSFNNPIYFSDPSGLMDDNFLQDLWDKTPNDGLIHHYDGNGNQTGTTDPDEIAIAEHKSASGLNGGSKEEQKRISKIRSQENYLNTRGMRGIPDALQDLVLNAGLNAQEIAEIAKLRTTLVKNLKAQYMMAIFSPGNVADILFLGFGSGLSQGVSNKSFNYIARGSNNAFSAIGSTGKVGERILQLLGGESQVGFKTTTGMRYVDQLVKGAAFESKVGYTSLTKSIARQIAKDVELISQGRINSSTWHFFKSPVTGKLGASKPLLEALKTAGIKSVMH